MSLIYLEGFDDDLYTVRSTNGSAQTPNTANGRLGLKGVRLGNTPNLGFEPRTQWSMGGSDTIVVGFAMRIVSWGSSGVPGYAASIALLGSGQYFSIDRSGITNNFLLRINAVNYSMDTDISSFPDNEWHYVEFKVKFHASTGTVEFRLDGNTTASYTSLNTGSPPGDWYPGAWMPNGTPYMNEAWFDDVYVLNGAGSANNDFLGDVQILPLSPNANGNSSVLVGSDGNSTDNYLLVNDSSNSTYVGSATEGDKDTYGMSDLAVTSGSVLGVMTSIVGTRSDSGNKYLRHVIRSGGTDYPSSSFLVPATPSVALTEVPWDTDPDTASAWTASGVNAIELGPEVRDS